MHDAAAPDGSVGEGLHSHAYIDGDFDVFGADDVKVTYDSLSVGIAWASTVAIIIGPMAPTRVLTT